MTGSPSANSRSGPAAPQWDDRISEVIVALRRSVPERSSASLRLVGVGLSTVVIGDEETVCRVPLNREAAAAQARLRSLLPLLAPYLPIPIPVPLYEIPAGAHLPFGALVLRKLPGQPLARASTSPTLASTLANFLAALQSLPTTLALADLLLRHDCDAADREIQAAALTAFQAMVSEPEREAAVRWWDTYLADPDLREFRPIIVHGDFWHENVLVNAAGDRVTGVIDWENCGLGDPAMDLAPLWHANPILFEAVLTRYAERTGTAPAALRQRARWQFGLREWVGLAWTIRLDDTREFPDAVAKVRAMLAADGTEKER